MDPELIMEDKPKTNGKIRTMPSQYLPAQKKSSSIGKYLVIGTIVVLVVVIIAMAILFVVNLNSTPAPVVQEPVVTEQPDPTPEQEPEPIVELEPEPEPDVDRVELPLINLNNTPALDTDQDGLTDQEEAIFITSNAVPDTDGDGFLDGAEIVNLYDPATPTAFLEASPQVKIGRNPGQSYQFLLPTTWTSTINTPRGEELIIRPFGSNDDVFTINVYPNPDRLEVTEWYRENVDLPDLAGFKNFDNPAGWTGIQSRDNLVVMATFGESGPGARAFIYVMEYKLGTANSINYPSIWSMILNSIDILEPEQEETN
jgi:hypothetical protein